MTLDEIEKLASGIVERGYTHDSGPPILDLASAFLLVLPVLRAAMQWDGFEGTVRVGSLVDPETTLRTEIAAMRGAMTEGK